MTRSRFAHKLAHHSTLNDAGFPQLIDRFLADAEFREYIHAVLPQPGRRAGCLLGLTVYIDGAVDRTAAAIVKIRQHTGRFGLRIITVICSLGNTPASDARLCYDPAGAPLCGLVQTSPYLPAFHRSNSTFFGLSRSSPKCQ